MIICYLYALQGWYSDRAFEISRIWLWILTSPHKNWVSFANISGPCLHICGWEELVNTLMSCSNGYKKCLPGNECFFLPSSQPAIQHSMSSCLLLHQRGALNRLLIDEVSELGATSDEQCANMGNLICLSWGEEGAHEPGDCGFFVRGRGGIRFFAEGSYCWSYTTVPALGM